MYIPLWIMWIISCIIWWILLGYWDNDSKKEFDFTFKDKDSRNSKNELYQTFWVILMAYWFGAILIDIVDLIWLIFNVLFN